MALTKKEQQLIAAGDERVGLQLRIPKRLLDQVKQRHVDKQRELIRSGIRPEAWSRNDQLIELIQAGLREGKGRG